jgi:hypothetical protein
MGTVELTAAERDRAALAKVLADVEDLASDAARHFDIHGERIRGRPPGAAAGRGPVGPQAAGGPGGPAARSAGKR